MVSSPALPAPPPWPESQPAPDASAQFPSSSGKAKLLGISKRGNSSLRRILVSGEQSLLRWSPRRTDALGRWVTALRQKKPWNLVAVALANKNARVIWHRLRYDVDSCPQAAEA
jgi:transposase